MELDIKPAVKLIKKPNPFKSANVKGLTLCNSEYFKSGNKSSCIEENRIMDLSGVNAEHSTRKLADGAKFEVFRMKDVILKFIKNKYGEIIAYKFKGMNKSDAMSKEKIVENTTLAFASKIRNFLFNK